MQRREFITLLGGAATAWPFILYAQPRSPRVGILYYGQASSPAEIEIVRELARMGYVDGRNITYVIRAVQGDTIRLPEFARELVTEKPDVIVSMTSSAAVALFNTTHDIPVVMTNVGDPVALGLTTSISHPTQNITGFTISSLSLAAKRLEILHDIVPSLQKVAYLWTPANPVAQGFKSQVQRAADKLGIKLVSLPLTSYADIDAAFAHAEQEKATAVLVETSELALINSGRIVDECLFYNLPCLHTWPIEVRNGALISYGPKALQNISGAADYVDRILKGAKVSELPFVEPTEVEMAINLRTARTLGIAIPPTVLVRAEDVIE